MMRVGYKVVRRVDGRYLSLSVVGAWEVEYRVGEWVYGVEVGGRRTALFVWEDWGRALADVRYGTCLWRCEYEPWDIRVPLAGDRLWLPPTRCREMEEYWKYVLAGDVGQALLRAPGFGPRGVVMAARVRLVELVWMPEW